MKKRTSKSASGIRKASLPSGTSGLTGATASKPLKKQKRVGRYQKVVATVNGMTPVEFRKSLVTAGIIGAAGTLAKKYKKHK